VFQLGLGALGATTPADFADPTSGSRLAVCLYSGSPAAPSAIARASIAGGDTCGGVPCWRGLGSPAGSKGYKRKDRLGGSDGFTSVLLRSGGSGRASITMKAKGTGVRTPGLPLALPVRARVQAASGAGWEAEFTAANQTRNDALQFKGRGN
jgi:hypothetical protein